MACGILAVSFRSSYISVDSMMLVVNDWTSERANQPANQPTYQPNSQSLKYVCVSISSMVMHNTGFFHFELFCCSIFVCTSIFIDITMQLRRMWCSSFKNRNGKLYSYMYYIYVMFIVREFFSRKFYDRLKLYRISKWIEKKMRKAQREVTDVMWLNMMNETFNRCYHDVEVKPSINQIFTEKQPLYI